MEHPERPKIEASIWIKIISVCAILLVGMVGYSSVSTSKNEQCRANGMTSLILIDVVDTQWSFSGCQYLIKWKHVESPPTWQNQSDLDSFIASQKKAEDM